MEKWKQTRNPLASRSISQHAQGYSLRHPTIRMLFMLCFFFFLLPFERNWNCGKVENFSSHTLILLD